MRKYGHQNPRGMVWAIVGFATLVGHSSASAQSRSLNIERFAPAFDDSGFLGLNGTRTPEPYRLALGLHLDLAIDPLELEREGEEWVAVQKRVTTQIAAEIGLFGRLAVGARLPLIMHQRGQMLPPPDAGELDSFAVGDPELVARYRFVGVSMAERDAPRDGPGVALQLSASLPIGTEDAYAGEGAVRTEAALLADFQLLGAGLGASLGWRHHFRDTPEGGFELGDELTFAAAIKLPLPPAPAIVGVLEFRGATDFQSSDTTALELALGGNLALGDFAVLLAGAVGLNDGIGTPDGRVTLGLRWSPSRSDADGDGLSDGADECPFLAEDPDGFQDEDGCPEPDNDNDLIPDLDDRCPDVQAEEGKDDDEDGCTD
jgi:hypothetical protein